MSNFGGETKEAAPLADLPGDGLDHLRRPVSENQRPISHVQVNVFVAVGVPQTRPLAAVGDQREVIGQDAHCAAIAAGQTPPSAAPRAAHRRSAPR